MSEPRKAEIVTIRQIIEGVMGWPVLVCEEDGSHPHQGDHEWLCNSANYPNVTMQGRNFTLWRTPEMNGEDWNPLTDDAAAFEVVEAMHRRHMLSCRIAYISSAQIGVIFYTSVGAQNIFTESMDRRGIAYSSRFGDAVCRAALEALRVKRAWNL